MSAAILICNCGRRLKAASIAPGKSGRCPSCGALVRVPATARSTPDPSKDSADTKQAARPRARPARQVEVPKPPESPPAAPAGDDEWNWTGIYELAPETPPAKRRASAKKAIELPEPLPDADEVAESSTQASSPAAATDNDEWNWKGTYDLMPVEAPRAATPVAGQTAFDIGDLPPRATADRREKPPPQAEAWWPPKFMYPLRAGEGVCMVAALGGTFWIMGTLIPEYCLTLVADGEKLGAELMGRLIVMLSALPFVIMVPLVLFYWFLYLGRVLVASADGDNRPPRPPDRNFEGFLTGILPWLIWLFLGVGVGFLPLAAYLAAVSQGAPWSPGAAVALGLCGFPYALMALLLTFLHDDSLAANPWAVLANIARLFPSFSVLCLTTLPTLALAPGAFVCALAMRNRYFYVYIIASLGCWMLLVWCSLVAMHTLGSYCALRKDRLNWQRKWVTWGAEWKL